jgi:oligopeptide transport system ATP-binding protein
MRWPFAKAAIDRRVAPESGIVEGRPPDNTVVSVRCLVKDFPLRGSREVVHAVNDVSLDVQCGETLALVGESGSGKTTIGRCILKLIAPSCGQIYFQGQEITAMSDGKFRHLRPRIQMVFQEPYESLNPRMTVRQILDENLYMEGRLDRAQRKQRIQELMDMVRLPHIYLDRYPHELTGGEQQRVGIARAISTQPDFVVHDEITSNLDISVRAEIIELLMRLQHEFALSYLFISHDLTAVREISDRVAIMYLGKIIELAPTSEIFTYQLHPYGQALLSSVLLPEPGTVVGRVVLAGEIPSPVNPPKGCYLHPRCPFAKEKCRHDPFPPMESFFDGRHESACWFACDFVPR